jgi:CRP-like cAMP-binding protein
MNGWVKLHQATMEGNEAVLALFTRGDSFGEAILIDDAVYPHSAEALEESKIIEFPASLLKEIAACNATFTLHLIQSMTKRIEQLQLENEHLAVMTTIQRVACLINQMCLLQNNLQKHGNKNHLQFPYDKHLAAVRLGMKPETFSRALKELHEAGVDVAHNEITVKGHETLEEICCSNCSASPHNCPLAKNGSYRIQMTETPKSTALYPDIHKASSHRNA